MKYIEQETLAIRGLIEKEGKSMEEEGEEISESLAADFA